MTPTWVLTLPAFGFARYRVGLVRVKAPGKAMNFDYTDEQKQFADVPWMHCFGCAAFVHAGAAKAGQKYFAIYNFK